MEFKIGDKVYDPRYGWGIVTDYHESSTLPIYVKYSNDVDRHYTKDGKLFSRDLAPYPFPLRVYGP